MHTMTAAQAEQQLTDLAEQFAHWRQQRTYRFAPFPRPLTQARLHEQGPRASRTGVGRRHPSRGVLLRMRVE